MCTHKFAISLTLLLDLGRSRFTTVYVIERVATEIMTGLLQPSEIVFIKHRSIAWLYLAFNPAGNIPCGSPTKPLNHRRSGFNSGSWKIIKAKTYKPTGRQRTLALLKSLTKDAVNCVRDLLRKVT
jgi:hypothetical protein